MIQRNDGIDCLYDYNCYDYNCYDYNCYDYNCNRGSTTVERKAAYEYEI